MRLLTAEEFTATIGTPPAPVDVDESAPFDFWPYFDAIPREDLGGHDFSDEEVTHVWQMPDGTHQHVLIACDTPNVFLALVLDLRTASVAGHHVLDLNQIYGLSQPSAPDER
ncbi:hypothetical protein AB0B83_18535 [Micromonospora sp. NPDC049060]|uniref:hypothetical protein n=1 Tax=Micromonospora sp. NPDC049060 TaxID=3154828 RepID=UPI0033DBD798